MQRNKGLRDRSLTATVIISVVIVGLMMLAYVMINQIITDRCQRRLEEGVNTVISEVTDKLTRESRLLTATADIIANAKSFDVATLKELMDSVAPLLQTMQVRILLPDNTVIQSDGKVLDATGTVSFAVESALGEHVSNRMSDLVNDSLVLRQFVPIVRNGETVAMVYGLTVLEDLPNLLNISNIYNASASTYIIDTETGDFIMDTWHEGLGNLNDYYPTDMRGGEKWHDTIEDILKGHKGYVVLKSSKANDWLHMYYAPAGINQWTVAVSVPQNEVFASLYAVQHVCWAIGVMLVIVLVIYYYWVHRNAVAATEKAVERAVLEEKLHKAEAAERAKTIFLSNMSHDIRTPMNAIIGFTTLAQTNLDKRERVQEYLGKILSSSNHLLSLINDILDMSRIESGKLNIEEKECSISDIFRDMRNIIQTQMQTKQLNFFMDTLDVVDEDIYCDKLHVNQVLLNLLSNAIKFTPAGGSVSLMISQKPGAPKGFGAYEIRVKDTGIGMSSEFAKHIFEPFERERNSTVSGIQGTGLGMAITKSIVDTMGGTIQVETEQGKGTEFIINLRFRLQAAPKQVESIPELEGMRALVVDDSFSTCDSVTKMLSQIGLRAEWTMHGKEAVLRARQAVEMEDEFFAYIIDWALPDLSGLEVVRQVRAIVGEKAPIIILTAYDWSVIEDEARQAGVTAFCNKPLFISDLRDTLVTAMGKDDQVQEQNSVLPATSEDLKGLRLLLVEDNELNREIAEELLLESGFEIETAEDGSVAVEKVKASEPGYYALILMDIQMPIMNGYEATRAIRRLSDPGLSTIPIIAMTANAFDEDRKKALDSGMNAHVAKPIDVEKLMSALQTLLAAKKGKA